MRTLQSLPERWKTLAVSALQAAVGALRLRGVSKPTTDAQRSRVADLAEMDAEPAKMDIAEVLSRAVSTLKVWGRL